MNRKVRASAANGRADMREGETAGPGHTARAHQPDRALSRCLHCKG